MVQPGDELKYRKYSSAFLNAFFGADEVIEELAKYELQNHTKVDDAILSSLLDQVPPKSLIVKDPPNNVTEKNITTWSSLKEPRKLVVWGAEACGPLCGETYSFQHSSYFGSRQDIPNVGIFDNVSGVLTYWVTEDGEIHFDTSRITVQNIDLIYYSKQS